MYQTIDTGFTANADGTISVAEGDFTTVEDGVIREIVVTLTEGGSEYKTSVGYDVTAPDAPTNFAATPKSDRATITWTDSVSKDVDHYTMAVFEGTDNTGTRVIFENVNANVQTYSARHLDSDKDYFVEIKAVDTAKLESTALSGTFHTLAS